MFCYLIASYHIVSYPIVHSRREIERERKIERERERDRKRDRERDKDTE